MSMKHHKPHEVSVPAILHFHVGKPKIQEADKLVLNGEAKIPNMASCGANTLQVLIPSMSQRRPSEVF